MGGDKIQVKYVYKFHLYYNFIQILIKYNLCNELSYSIFENPD